MVTIVWQMLGWLAFLVGTVAAGAWLRRHPGRRQAEYTSRMLHLVFWMGVVPPALVGPVAPGLRGFDRALGLRPLPGHPVVLIVGFGGLLVGIYLLIASNVALGSAGGGLCAFVLTERLVVEGIYSRTRHPMALGLYLGAVGAGLVVGSTYMTLAALLVTVPVHLLYLRYFEAYELELRLGRSCAAYRRDVPFLLPRWSSGERRA